MVIAVCSTPQVSRDSRQSGCPRLFAQQRPGPGKISRALASYQFVDRGLTQFLLWLGLPSRVGEHRISAGRGGGGAWRAMSLLPTLGSAEAPQRPPSCSAEAPQRPPSCFHHGRRDSGLTSHAAARGAVFRKINTCRFCLTARLFTPTYTNGR
jgi:hypothetical protein